MTPEQIKKMVQTRYNRFAQTGFRQQSFPDGSENYNFGLKFYEPQELSIMPQNAFRLASGCGNPVGFSPIRTGSSIVDLGCGGGVDIVLAARRAGETGRVIGIDISPEMVGQAKRSVSEAGLQHRSIFCRVADIEVISLLPKNFADVLISNCVISLCLCKKTVYHNIFRVLKPDGIFVVSDIVLTDKIDEHLHRRFRSTWTGCLGGAVLEEDLMAILRQATYMDIQVLGRYHLNADELDIVGSDPGADYGLSPPREDLLPLVGKVAGITVTARRPPINC